MATRGEQFRDRIFVEAPDFCTSSCEELAGRLLLIPGEVDSGDLIPEVALEPLCNLVRSCPKAVEAGGISPVGAKIARLSLNSLNLRREGDSEAPCAFRTFASWHAQMYAEGADPYDGFLDFDDD